MAQLNCAVVGSGRSVSECVRVLEAFNNKKGQNRIALKRVFIDQKNYVPSQTTAYPVQAVADMNATPITQTIADEKIDYLFSVNNHQILKQPVFDSVGKAVLNFHNGPLPRYGGVNACAWAIFNGEVEHGISWHVMVPQIDAGPILSQRMFPLRPSETAISLIMKCIDEGMIALETLLPDLFTGCPKGIPQDPALRTYYSKNDVPADGIFNWRWNFAQADRYMRSLNTTPFPPMLPFGRGMCGGRMFRVSKLTMVNGATPNEPGRVTAVTGDGLEVSLADCVVKLTSMISDAGVRLNAAEFIDTYNPVPGMMLDFNDNGVRHNEG